MAAEPFQSQALNQNAFSWDAAGRLTGTADNSGRTDYARDLPGRVTAKTQTVNDNLSSPTQLKLAYGYQGGDLASVIYPSGA